MSNKEPSPITVQHEAGHRPLNVLNRFMSFLRVALCGNKNVCAAPSFRSTSI
jgi:hypothetical protein